MARRSRSAQSPPVRPTLKVRFQPEDRVWLRALLRRCRTGDLKGYGSVNTWARVQLLLAAEASGTFSTAGVVHVSAAAYRRMREFGPVSPLIHPLQESD